MANTRDICPRELSPCDLDGVEEKCDNRTELKKARDYHVSRFVNAIIILAMLWPYTAACYESSSVLKVYLIIIS
jgi:hypothetical protein